MEQDTSIGEEGAAESATDLFPPADAPIRHTNASKKKKTRCDSAPVLPTDDTQQQRLSVCSTSGMVYESVVVVGHLYGKDNVVYYLVEVRSFDTPLDNYVIRRRYNEFKKFYQALATIMPTSCTSRSIFSTRYSSFLCTPLPLTAPESSPLWSPPRSIDQRRASASGPVPPPSQRTENNTRCSAPTMDATHQSPLPLDAVVFNAEGRALLPPLPDAGVRSFFASRHMLIRTRIAQFNRILAAVMSDPSPQVASILMHFIQQHPGNQPQYVTLSHYAPPEMPFSVERHARRRAASMTKKPNNTLTVA